jgi:hypothetical protein
MIEQPDGYSFDDKFFEYAARKAESEGWYICFDKEFTCYCPECRKKRGL